MYLYDFQKWHMHHLQLVLIFVPIIYPYSNIKYFGSKSNCEFSDFQKIRSAYIILNIMHIVKFWMHHILNIEHKACFLLRNGKIFWIQKWQVTSVGPRKQKQLIQVGPRKQLIQKWKCTCKTTSLFENSN